MLDVLALAEQDVNLHNKACHEKAGPCPRCGGRDRFSVKWNGTSWVFQCRGCWDAQEIAAQGRKRGWGDAIDYLRHMRGLSYQEARALVGQSSDEPAPRRVAPDLRKGYESDDWQSLYAALIKDYVTALHAPEGAACLEYIRARGLSDEVIDRAMLGYSVKDDIPRLIIPAVNDRRIVAIYRRDLRPGTAERWKDAPGGTKSELYGADMLKRRGYPIVLVESAIDALSLVQTCRDVVNVVATGSANCGFTTKWIARLACAPLVLVAFDADGPGDKRAGDWLNVLENARRLRPLLHDVNDMLVDGWDIRAWIDEAIGQALPLVETTPGGDELATACDDCHAPIEDQARDFFYAPDGTLYCTVCRDEATGTRRGISQERFMEIGHKIAASIGAELHFDPPGYTLADRARELATRPAQSGDGQEAYWARVHRELLRSGYHAQYERDQARLYPAIEKHQRDCFHPDRWTFPGASAARLELATREVSA